MEFRLKEQMTAEEIAKRLNARARQGSSSNSIEFRRVVGGVLKKDVIATLNLDRGAIIISVTAEGGPATEKLVAGFADEVKK